MCRSVLEFKQQYSGFFMNIQRAKKRASNRLNFIHNNTHSDLNIQDRNGFSKLNDFKESRRVSSHSILITLVKSNN